MEQLDNMLVQLREDPKYQIILQGKDDYSNFIRRQEELGKIYIAVGTNSESYPSSICPCDYRIAHGAILCDKLPHNQAIRHRRQGRICGLRRESRPQTQRHS